MTFYTLLEPQMKFFKRRPKPVPPSDTPIFARLAVESPLPTWDDVEQVAA